MEAIKSFENILASRMLDVTCFIGSDGKALRWLSWFKKK